jgi:GDP-L-galactose phosphorylase
VNVELLYTQVNPTVWEIIGYMVLKRKDYEEAFEENTWRLLSEVSLSEERFQEVNALIFEVIACVDNVSKATFLISISNEMKLILLNFAKF